jgi:hypothetical protein
MISPFEVLERCTGSGEPVRQPLMHDTFSFCFYRCEVASRTAIGHGFWLMHDHIHDGGHVEQCSGILPPVTFSL